jgi:magnesium-transporting ATPase (P-type)
VDKTGTITSDRMNVERIEEIESMGKENRVIDVSREYFEPLLATLVEAQADDNETMQAIKRYFNNKKITNEVRKKLANVTGSIVKILGFSSKYYRMVDKLDKDKLILQLPKPKHITSLIQYDLYLMRASQRLEPRLLPH